MSAVMTDIHIKYVVEFTLATVRKNPDKYVREIFGDAKIDPHAVFYGDRTINDVKEWITRTNIPVSLGFDLTQAQFPGVTINLERSSPSQSYMGDVGQQYSVPLEPHERAIILEAFVPQKINYAEDQSYATVILPATITNEQRQLISPGMMFRDYQGNLFAIGEDLDMPTLIPQETPLLQGDFQRLEVVSPWSDARYLENAMLFEEVALVTVYGHANRNEGLWLYTIVHWGLLKFRPLLTATFGMDLGMPMASDFSKDDTFLGENIWRRFITLSAKAVWSWEGPRQGDAVAFVLGLNADAGAPNATGSPSNPPGSPSNPPGSHRANPNQPQTVDLSKKRPC